MLILAILCSNITFPAEALLLLRAVALPSCCCIAVALPFPLQHYPYRHSISQSWSSPQGLLRATLAASIAGCAVCSSTKLHGSHKACKFCGMHLDALIAALMLRCRSPRCP